MFKPYLRYIYIYMCNVCEFVLKSISVYFIFFQIKYVSGNLVHSHENQDSMLFS